MRHLKFTALNQCIFIAVRNDARRKIIVLGNYFSHMSLCDVNGHSDKIWGGGSNSSREMIACVLPLLCRVLTPRVPPSPLYRVLPAAEVGSNLCWYRWKWKVVEVSVGHREGRTCWTH